MHRHPIIRRWADLDALNHVNNVKYGEWAKDALLAAQLDGYLPSGALWPASVAVTYRKPVMLSSGYIWIETEFIAGKQIQQAIIEEKDGERVEYATIVTDLQPNPDAFAEPVESRYPYTLKARRIEATSDGRIDFPRYLEYFQEGRIYTMWRALSSLSSGAFVVGTFRMDLGAPLIWQVDPFRVHTWLARIGNSSLDLTSQIRNGDNILVQGTATLVGFDLETQKSRRFSDEERETYATLAP